jgi:hypothetical protein
MERIFRSLQYRSTHTEVPVPNYSRLVSKPENGDYIYDVDDLRQPTIYLQTVVADQCDDNPDWVEVRYDNDPDNLVPVRWREMFFSRVEVSS